MNPKNTKLSAMRIGIIASLIVAAVHLILLGASYQRNTAAKQLNEDRTILEENLQELEKVNQEQLDELEVELNEIKLEISALEASFPEVGAPFAMFDQVQKLTQKSLVNLKSITRINTGDQKAAAGEFIIAEYSIEVDGDLINCFQFIEEIEVAGLDSILIEYASFWPAEQLCALEVRSFGLSDLPAD